MILYLWWSISGIMLIKDVSLIRSGQLLKGRDILIADGKISKIGRDLQDDSRRRPFLATESWPFPAW